MKTTIYPKEPIRFAKRVFHYVKIISILVLIGLFSAPSALSQIPQGFNYQALARTDVGEPLANQALQVRLTIQSDSLGGTIFWKELHTGVLTNATGVFSLILGKGTKQSGIADSFSDIDWNTTPKFLMTEIDHGGWKTMGSSRLWSMPYAMTAGELSGAVRKLEVAGETSLLDEALFEVKNKNGQTVFAVYNEGVRVYVGDGENKSVKGGFAIGSMEESKQEPRDIFIVNSDSVRIYLHNDPSGKPVKGGFAIGSMEESKLIPKDLFIVNRDSVRVYLVEDPEGKPVKGGFAIGSMEESKGIRQDYLVVNRDSVRVYIDETPSKPVKGGFAIGSFEESKATGKSYFDVATDVTGIIDPSENRILWYPLKNAFLTGRVLIERPDSVGENSFASGFESKATGAYSQALGYQAIARGDYSTSIGYQSIASKSNSFAFGQYAQSKNEESYAFGRGATAEGFRSYAFGSIGVDSLGVLTDVTYAAGNYSFAIGQGSQALGQGAFAIGLADTARGDYSLALGYKTSANRGYSTSLGYHTQAGAYYATAMGAYTRASGTYSTAIGFSTTAANEYATSMGFLTRAYGIYSTSLGCWTEASGSSSIAMGNSTTASGSAATAMGNWTTASGSSSTSMGNNTTASGSYSAAIGAFVTSASGYETVIGRYDLTYTPASTTGWNSTDRLFVLANGTGSGTRSNAMTVLKNGRIGLQSVTVPTYALHLPNSIASGVGVARAYAWTTYSDGRVKTERNVLDYGLAEVMKLVPVSYIHHNTTFNGNGIEIQQEGVKDIGLIAQEVYRIIPEAVIRPEDDHKDLWGLNYNKLVPVLTKAIQEQQEIIESQKAIIESLEERLAIIEILIAGK